MRLLGLDFETTGLDTSSERIVEIGLCLWEVETKRPIVTLGLFLKDDGIKARIQDKDVQAMMERVSGITPAMLEEFGTDATMNFQWMDKFVERHKPDYVVAHNGENFDKPIMLAELKRLGVPADDLRAIPWIDTKTDIPFANEPDSRKLKHLAADHGFINPFAHRAAFDVLTMLRVLSNYPIQDVLAYQKIPFVVMRAMVSYDDREKAKAERYSWEKIGDEVFPKCWVKKVKENYLQQEMDAAKKRGFEIVKIR